MSNAELQTATAVLDRIKDAYDLDTDASLAEKLDVATSTVATWRKRDSIPYQRIISKCEDVDLNWTFGTPASSRKATSESLPEDRTEVNVPVYAARLGAGDAGYGEDRIIAQGRFFEDWLRNVAHVTPEKAFICEVRGRSMEDLLEDRDLVLGERKEVVDRQEDIYALELNGHLYVKYVVDLNDRFELRSENPAFGTREVTADDKFRIIGRVVRRIVR
jgi:phage repressor protein C with HTH and peptisase S24 domain